MWAAADCSDGLSLKPIRRSRPAFGRPLSAGTHASATLRGGAPWSARSSTPHPNNVRSRSAHRARGYLQPLRSRVQESTAAGELPGRRWPPRDRAGAVRAAISAASATPETSVGSGFPQAGNNSSPGGHLAACKSPGLPHLGKNCRRELGHTHAAAPRAGRATHVRPYAYRDGSDGPRPPESPARGMHFHAALAAPGAPWREKQRGAAGQPCSGDPEAWGGRQQFFLGCPLLRAQHSRITAPAEGLLHACKSHGPFAHPPRPLSAARHRSRRSRAEVPQRRS